MNVEINKTQLRFFNDLFKELIKKQVNLNKIEELKILPQFKVCRNILIQICKEEIKKEENKTIPQTVELHLQDLLNEYMKIPKNNFNKKIFNTVLKNYFNYLENEQNKLFYFSPIYNFEFDGDELLIDEFIKIRKILEDEQKYLLDYYENFSPIKVSIRKIKYVFIINIKNNVDDPANLAREKTLQAINRFKIIKQGDIRSGGLYNFAKSDNWNPKNKFDRIFIEPVGIFSKNKYFLSKKHSEKFQTLLNKISNRYPMLEIDTTVNNTTENKKIKNYLEKYNDYFDRVIRRFSGALEKQNESEKIVDLVLTLEILLVSSPGDSTLKLSQRTALFIGKSDKEKLEIWRYMQPFYNFRSGQVHEFTDRAMKMSNLPEITKNEAIKKLEVWARRSILQMIFFSQERTSSKLTAKQLYKKIDESMFDSKLNLKFLKLSKEISKQLNLS